MSVTLVMVTATPAASIMRFIFSCTGSVRSVWSQQAFMMNMSSMPMAMIRNGMIVFTTL